MQKFKDGLDRVLSLVAAAGLVLMMTHIVVNAVLRFFVNQPLYATNELVAYWYLPIVALLGIPASQMQHEQIVVTLAVDKMKLVAANTFRVFACLVSFLASVGFAWFGFLEALHQMNIQSTAGVTDVIAWPVYFVVPFAFVLLALLLVLEVFAILAVHRSEAGMARASDSDPASLDRADTNWI